MGKFIWVPTPRNNLLTQQHSTVTLDWGVETLHPFHQIKQRIMSKTTSRRGRKTKESVLPTILQRAKTSDEVFTSNWSRVEGSELMFGDDILDKVSKCTLLRCEGESNDYWSIKLQLEGFSQAFWFTMDAPNTARCRREELHNLSVDPAELVSFQLRNKAGETISRIHLFAEGFDTLEEPEQSTGDESFRR